MPSVLTRPMLAEYHTAIEILHLFHGVNVLQSKIRKHRCKETVEEEEENNLNLDLNINNLDKDLESSYIKESDQIDLETQIDKLETSPQKTFNNEPWRRSITRFTRLQRDEYRQRRCSFNCRC